MPCNTEDCSKIQTILEEILPKSKYGDSLYTVFDNAGPSRAVHVQLQPNNDKGYAYVLVVILPTKEALRTDLQSFIDYAMKAAGVLKDTPPT